MLTPKKEARSHLRWIDHHIEQLCTYVRGPTLHMAHHQPTPGTVRTQMAHEVTSTFGHDFSSAMFREKTLEILCNKYAAVQAAECLAELKAAAAATQTLRKMGYTKDLLESVCGSSVVPFSIEGFEAAFKLETTSAVVAYDELLRTLPHAAALNQVLRTAASPLIGVADNGREFCISNWAAFDYEDTTFDEHLTQLLRAQHPSAANLRAASQGRTAASLLAAATPRIKVLP